MVSEPQAGREDLATGGAEGAPETTEEREAVAKDGSCVRLRPLRPNHVWAYDFVATRTHDGRGVRLLGISRVTVRSDIQANGVPGRRNAVAGCGILQWPQRH